MESLLDSKYKNILLQIFREFVRVCETNDLSYFLIAGSCLGAVRHNGMIPWDDDIDVAMPRKDYETLLSISDVVFDNKFTLLDYRKGLNYYHSCAKLMYKSSTVIERLGPYLCIDGVFIDVFPIDGFPSSEYERVKHCDKLNHISKIYIKTCFLSYSECMSLSDLFMSCFYRSYWGYKKIIDKLEKESMSYDISYSEYAVVSHSDYWQREIVPSETYKKFCVLDFEGMKVRVPFNYKQYLSKIYGNYMTLPPKEKRVLPHKPLILDIEKKVKLTDISVPLEKYKRDNAFFRCLISLLKRKIRYTIKNYLFSH